MPSNGQTAPKPSRSPRAGSAVAVPSPDAATAGADAAEIAAAQDRFISFWGEMGTRWGVQRSMAEVHALLFIAGEPLSAEDVMDRLRLSRGSVSTVLRQLVEWGLIQRVRAKERSDRREYFQAEQDVWKLFYTILRARKRREFDPLVEELGGCRVSARGGRRTERERAHDRRIDELLELCVFFDGLANTISRSGKGIERATRLLARVLGGGK
ncbi:MAG: MarR family transcriptional regulator [Phycisphaera sp.]|nr:MarR family transcriptional regulator [Phycisphaera sp.]